MSYRSITDEVIAANTGAALPFPAADSGGGGMFDPMSFMSGFDVPGMGGGFSSSATSSADSRFDSSFGFDNSGWNVNIGGGSITSDREQAAPMVGDVVPVPGQGWIMTAGMVIAGLIALKIFMKGRK